MSFDNKGPLAVDGQGGAAVSCRVKPVGSGFDITANISTPVPGTQNTSFFITATLANLQMGSMVGTVTIGDSATGGTGYSSGIVNSSPPQGICTFDSHPTEGVAAGKVYARAKCTDARGFGLAGALCDFSPEGYFVFENCATQ